MGVWQTRIQTLVIKIITGSGTRQSVTQAIAEWCADYAVGWRLGKIFYNGFAAGGKIQSAEIGFVLEHPLADLRLHFNITIKFTMARS